MEFNNLECNILFLVGSDQDAEDMAQPLDPASIYKQFSDIPEESVRTALINLKNDGSLRPFNETPKLSLTAKGTSRIRALFKCLREISGNPQQRTSGCC